MWGKQSLPCEFAEAYRLVERLGQGGMAEVYRAEVTLERFNFAKLIAYGEILAEESRTKRMEIRAKREQLWAQKDWEELRDVAVQENLPYPADGTAAIKILLPSAESVAERFIGEWEQLMTIRHPNVIKVYDGGRWEERWYYAMELISGTLAPKERQELPLLTKMQIGLQAAQGIAELHRCNIIHRDIKPDNIITYRDAKGQLITKITDLGIAKDMLRATVLTLTQEIIGTPNFMAPEQFKRARDVDQQADIYSLGATLYALLAGQPPYANKSVFEIIAAVTSKLPPIALRELYPDIPPEIESFIQEMMIHEPQARPSIDQVCYRLEAMCQELAAPPPRSTKRKSTVLKKEKESKEKSTLPKKESKEKTDKDKDAGGKRKRLSQKLKALKAKQQAAKEALVVRPASGIKVTRPASGIKVTRPASGIKVTRPASGIKVTRSASSGKVARTGSKKSGSPTSKKAVPLKKKRNPYGTKCPGLYSPNSIDGLRRKKGDKAPASTDPLRSSGVYRLHVAPQTYEVHRPSKVKVPNISKVRRKKKKAYGKPCKD